MPRSKSYQEDLIEALKDPLEAQEYLNAALEDGNSEVFLRFGMLLKQGWVG